MKKLPMMILTRWSLLLVLAALGGMPCAGDDKVKEETKELGIYLGQHGYGATPLDNSETNRESITAMIDGKKVRLTVDTGCGLTKITASCAHRLKLDVLDSGHATSGIGGAVEGDDGVALVKSFTLNNYEINRLNMIHILPKSAYVHGMKDGLFGYDELRLNAVVLPIGANLLLFKPGGNPPPPIDHYMDLLGFKPIPLHFGKGGLHIEGQLDGQPLTAMVDCGAPFSTFDLGYVKAHQQALSTFHSTLRGVDGVAIPTFVFTPKQLNFGPVTFEPTLVVACQAPVFQQNECNALLGYDLLGAHKAIIDLGHEVLWMK